MSIEKVSFFRADGPTGPLALPLFARSASELVKVAAPSLVGDVARFIASLAPRPDAIYVLVNAMGAGEYWGANVNGDHFPEAALIHRPDDWAGDPARDAARARTWAYGFPTFYGAHPYQHHRNKDPARAYGEVELAAWNPRMKRVELVVRVDKDKCERFAGTGIWDKLSQGLYPDVSMGARVPFDTCAICLDWDAYRRAQSTFDPAKHKYPGEAVLAFHGARKAKGGLGIRGLSITRADYCEHARTMMNRILPDGRKVFVFNDYPKFFDISFVFVGADKTAKVMMKLAGGSTTPRRAAPPPVETADRWPAATARAKLASAQEELLRDAFLGKHAKGKEGAIVKNVTSLDVERAIARTSRVVSAS